MEVTSRYVLPWSFCWSTCSRVSCQHRFVQGNAARQHALFALATCCQNAIGLQSSVVSHCLSWGTQVPLDAWSFYATTGVRCIWCAPTCKRFNIDCELLFCSCGFQGLALHASRFRLCAFDNARCLCYLILDISKLFAHSVCQPLQL